MLERIKHRKRQIPRIVLVGGQCAGKSKLLNAIQTAWGDRMRYIPEFAGFVCTRFKYKPAHHTRDVQELIQYGFYECQCWLEFMAEQGATAGNCLAVVSDRGTLDGAAYYMGRLDDWCVSCRTTIEAEYGRYDLVILLGQADEVVYKRRSEEHTERNPSEYAVARARAEMIYSLWKRHPNVKCIPSFPTWEEKKTAALQEITNFLGREAAKPSTDGIESGQAMTRADATPIPV